MGEGMKRSIDTTAKIKQIDKITTVCLLLMLGIIPIITRAHITSFTSPVIIFQLLQSGEKFDIHVYDKFIFLIVFTFIISILFFIKLFVFNYRINKTNMNLFLMIFIIIILLSTYLSSYKCIALFGFYEHREGLVTFLCYTFILFITSNLKLEKNHIKLFFYVLSPFILINTVLNLLNFYGYNIYNIDFIKKLIVANISISEASKLEGTLYNRDYTSGIASLCICLYFILSIYEKRKSWKIFNIIILLSSFCMLLSSLATSGFVIIVILLPIILLILILKKKYKEFLFGVILLISFTFVYIPLYNHNHDVWNETFKPVFINKIHWQINTKKDTKHSKYGLEEIPKKNEEFLSGRGYIWKNTFPLLLRKPAIGYGLDTYVYSFPQFKLEQLSGLGRIEYVDKPHSLYLDIAYGTGFLGLLLFLIIIGYPILSLFYLSIKTKAQSFIDEPEIFAIIFGLLAFLLQGLVNDANLGTDIIFFIFLGILNFIKPNIEKFHSSNIPIQKG
jgi:hypothetical protein